MKKNGFSLLELLITMAVLGIISVVLTSIYIDTNKTFKIQKSQTLLQTESRNSLDFIDTWTRRASTIMTSYTTADLTVYTTSSTVLVLQVPSIDASQNILSNKYDYFVYKANVSSPMNLEERIYADASSARATSTKNLDQHLSSITFSYYDSSNNLLAANFDTASIIKTTITSEEVVSGKTNTVTVDSESKIRNK